MAPKEQYAIINLNLIIYVFHVDSLYLPLSNKQLVLSTELHM